MAKKEEAEENSLALLQSKYPALMGGGDVAAALEANLGGEKIAVWDLERIKVPSGGMLAWEIPGLSGVPTYEQSVEGIIMFHKLGRSFWKQSLSESGGGVPPDCSSPDNLIGIGDPGGECASCPYAQWGSAESDGDEKARGQACKQQRFVFILREGMALPSVIALPPTSLQPMKQWLMQITGKGKPYWCFLVRFNLIESRNKNGIKFAKAQPSIIRQLTNEEVAAAQQFAIQTRETFVQYREGVAQ